MNRDVIELVTAFAMIIACAWFAVATAQQGSRERRPKQGRATRPAPLEVSGAAPPPAAAVMPSPAGAINRARIFTGESASVAAGKPPAKRALRLVAGITALAAAGAIGLLALVGAIVKMFQGIGG